jgi:hypothetical protein
LATRTLTVVFTDLANYTASVGRSDREGLRNLIAAHESMVAPVLERHGGRVVKNLGDSYMALFAAATDAVRACLELVETFTGGDGFTIRGAMATGDVEEIKGDAFGEAVNLAARILSKAPAGETWFSEATQMCMNQAEIPWESVGRFALKGIARESKVFRAVPKACAWFAPELTRAVRSGRLVRIREGDSIPPMPPEPTVLLEGFEPGSQSLKMVVDSMPVIDPARLWLQVYRIAPSDRCEWVESGRGLVIGQMDSVSRVIEESNRPVTRITSSDTIILDMSMAAELDLVMAGLSLPSVPMSDVVAGYTFDLLPDGRWVNRSDTAVARVEVAPGEVRLNALKGGVAVNGTSLPAGQVMPLTDGSTISASAVEIVYHQVSTAGYIGLLLADSLARLGVAHGQQVEIGREPNHPGFAVADRRGQRNIRWCVGARAARARASGFTVDRALAGRRQAAVHLDESGAEIVSLHKTCQTFRYRGGAMQRVEAPLDLIVGDMIVVGTSVIALRSPLG